MGKVVKFAQEKKDATAAEAKEQAVQDTIAAVFAQGRAEQAAAALDAPPAETTKKPARKQRARETRPFLHVDRDLFTAGIVALKCPQAAVWAFILQRWRLTEEPVAVTNTALKEWHVGRKAKYAALRKLAKAGLIRVVGGSISRNPRVVPVL